MPNDVEKEKASDFIKEQYIHLNLHRTQVNGFSGQIIAIVFAGLVLSLGLKSENIEDWMKFPLLPAISFTAISIFFFVMYVSHSRNIVSRTWLDSLIAAMEKKYGIRPDELEIAERPKGRAWLGENLPSSRVVSFFLALMFISTLCLTIYLWFKYFTLK